MCGSYVVTRSHGQLWSVMAGFVHETSPYYMLIGCKHVRTSKDFLVVIVVLVYVAK